MANNITLSVTVLSFNNEQYVEDCLKSIVRQGIDSYEVFVVDDCSTDGSVEEIKKFIKDKPQFRLIEKEMNSGGAVSSQIGIGMSRGKYCAIIDSDDVIADGAYRILIDRLEKDQSDFAAGLPMKWYAGLPFSFLANTEENNIFAKDRVLESSEEKSNFFNQPYYWNAVYKTAFIKNNNIHMPSGLLIADRIFLFDAIFKANRISIDHNIVYYWRKKKNTEKKSITDRQNEYRGVADRIDSFEAQLRITLDNVIGEKENSNLSLNMWQNSIDRLFYSIKEILIDELVSEEELYHILDRYRIMFCMYPAFFLQLLDGCALDTKSAFIMKSIIEREYNQIIEFDESNNNKYYYDVNKKFMQNHYMFSIVRVGMENGRMYMYGQKNINADRFGYLKINKILAVSRYYKQNSIEIEYDQKRNRFDITDLPESTYNFMAIGENGKEPVMINCGSNTRFPVKINYEDDRLRITSSKNGGNPFSIMKKNKYTLLTRDGKILIFVNDGKAKIEKMFFYEMMNNNTIVLDEVFDSTYLIETQGLHDQSVLLAEDENGICSTVFIHQISNNKLSLKKYKNLFSAGRIEIKGQDINND